MTEQQSPPKPDASARYEIIETVGRGAMGQVFKAYDRSLQRHVALKFLKDDDPKEVTRVLREARAMARINHEHVVQVYEAGTQDGKPFLSMQFIDGFTLDKAADHLSLEQKLMVIREIAMAVQEAHRNGIIHRDLKPSNIMVEIKEDGSIKPWVMDFGVARILSADQTRDTNVFSGTPLYMAPEQLRGRQELDRRADVYSLGATLYECISGRPPFVGTSSVHIILKVIKEEPPLLRKHAPQVSRDLETIVMKCLAKEASQRYDSAKALAEDLHRFLSGDPILAHPPSLLYRGSKAIAKNKALSAVIAAGILTACVLGLWAIRERQQAAYRVVLAQEFSREAQTIENRMALVFAMPAHDISPEIDQANSAIATIEQEIKDIGHMAQGPGYYAIGKTYLALSQYDKALAYLRQAEDAGYRSNEFLAAMSHALTEVYRIEANQARHLSDNLSFREQHMEQLQKTYLDPARTYLAAMDSAHYDPYAMALIAYLDHDLNQAKSLIQSALIATPWRAECHVLEANILSDEALATEDGGSYSQADELYDQAIARIDEAMRYLPSHPQIHEMRIRLKQRKFEMLVEHVAGDDDQMFNELMVTLDEASAIQPKHAPLAIARCWTLQEWAHHELDRGRDALEISNRSVASGEEAVALANMNTDAYKALSLAQKFRAFVLEQQGLDPTNDFKESIKNMQTALDLAPRDWSALNGMGTILDQFAVYQVRNGQDSLETLQSAIDYLERAIAINPGFAFAHNNISMPYTDLAYYDINRGLSPHDSLERARDHLGKAIELNPNYYNAFYNLSWAHFMEGYYLHSKGQDPTPYIQKGIEASLRCVAINPDNVRAYHVRATSWALLGEYAIDRGQDPTEHLNNARENYLLLSDKTPNRHGFFNDLANTYLLEGRYRLDRGLSPKEALETAIDLLKKSLDVNPNASMPYVNTGYAFRDLAFYEFLLGREADAMIHEAENYFARGLEINPQYVNGLVGRAWLRNGVNMLKLDVCDIGKDGIEGADADIQKSLNMNPENAAAHVQASAVALIKAYAAYCAGKPDPSLINLAHHHAQEANRIRPNFAEYLRREAETIRWIVKIQKPLNRDLIDRALDCLEMARQNSEYTVHIDLEQAELMYLVATDRKQMEIAKEFAAAASEDRGAFGKRAQTLIQDIDLRLNRPDGS